MPLIIVNEMEEVDKGCPMIRMGVSGWVFLLVPAYPGNNTRSRPGIIDIINNIININILNIDLYA